ncbi:hypothetical protein [Streptomyces sp. GC420]|uniref:hypothetical protein n=1 Tax=Streptomyces sp. GC420 TaxID=2697568 RepID=UPI00141516ED|nr:hypothetical protein [Streptomyces sp. GC420]NBM17700.1 hypothetical protein [Streptomyces sp. GC420]
MPAIALLLAVISLGTEQLVQWRYGPMGLLGLVLLTVGIKADSPPVSAVGAAILAALVAGPAL